MGELTTANPAFSYRIDKSSREPFNSDGAILLRGVIDESWLDLLMQAIERDIAEPGPSHQG